MSIANLVYLPGRPLSAELGWYRPAEPLAGLVIPEEQFERLAGGADREDESFSGKCLAPVGGENTMLNTWPVVSTGHAAKGKCPMFAAIRMRTGFRVLGAVTLLALLPVHGVNAAAPGEVLYNGIVLPREWPPRLADFPTSVEKDPIIPPYLASPPAVIPIDVGRQLFVDDFLIAETTLKRTFHLAKYHPASPVLKPDQPWEMKNPDHAATMVFSDGVWYDPKDELFKMWYMVGRAPPRGMPPRATAFAGTSPSSTCSPEPTSCSRAAATRARSGSISRRRIPRGVSRCSG